jgi:hypothetical protein
MGDFYAVAASDTLVVAVGESGGNGMTSVSSDGQIWSLEQVAGSPLRSVAYGDGVFVAVGSSGRCSVSADGVAWTDVALSQDDYTHVAHVAGEFVVAGSQGEFRSDDGASWAFVSPSPRRLFAYGAGRHVSVGQDAKLYHSQDAMTWTEGGSPAAMGALAFGAPAPP